jgi:hypothetical protein
VQAKNLFVVSIQVVQVDQANQITPKKKGPLKTFTLKRKRKKNENPWRRMKLQRILWPNNNKRSSKIRRSKKKIKTNVESRPNSRPIKFNKNNHFQPLVNSFSPRRHVKSGQAMLLQQRKTFKGLLEALVKVNKLKPTKVANSDITTKAIKTRKNMYLKIRYVD